MFLVKVEDVTHNAFLARFPDHTFWRDGLILEAIEWNGHRWRAFGWSPLAQVPVLDVELAQLAEGASLRMTHVFVVNVNAHLALHVPYFVYWLLGVSVGLLDRRVLHELGGGASWSYVC